MKKLSLLILTLVISQFIGAQTFENAGEYIQYISAEQRNVMARNIEYISFAVHTDDEKYEAAKRQEVIDQIQKSKASIKKMPDYKGDKKLRDEAVDVLDEMMNTFNLDFADVTTKKKKSTNSFEGMEAFFKAQDKANARLDRANDQLQRALKAFAERNKVQLSFEATDESVSIIFESTEYERKLYLEYFRVTKAVLTFFDEVNANKASQAEFALDRIHDACIEAARTVEATGAFKGDLSLYNKLKDLISQTRSFADANLPNIVSYMKMNQKNLTQKDVDGYNEAITVFNEKFVPMLNQYEVDRNDFLKSHIPDVSVKGKAN